MEQHVLVYSQVGEHASVYFERQAEGITTQPEWSQSNGPNKLSKMKSAWRRGGQGKLWSPVDSKLMDIEPHVHVYLQLGDNAWALIESQVGPNRKSFKKWVPVLKFGKYCARV